MPVFDLQWSFYLDKLSTDVAATDCICKFAQFTNLHTVAGFNSSPVVATNPKGELLLWVNHHIMLHGCHTKARETSV